MTDSLKCPFCQQELIREGMNHWWCSCNIEHQGKELYGTTALWQALIQAKQDLEQSEKCCSAWETQALDYKAETIALSGKLEIARKALEEIAKEHTGTDGKLYACSFTAQQALEQIEHKDSNNDR